MGQVVVRGVMRVVTPRETQDASDGVMATVKAVEVMLMVELMVDSDDGKQ